MMTQSDQELALIEARMLAGGTSLRLDRCRHESNDTAAIWIFRGADQIGSISLYTRWKTNRMLPKIGAVSERYYDTLREAVADITAHAAEIN